MPIYTVASCEYAEQVRKLLELRLSLHGAAAEIGQLQGGLFKVNIPQEQTPILALALAELLTVDLCCFETARLCAMLPEEIRAQGAVLPRALAVIDRRRWVGMAKTKLEEYLSSESIIAAEGFLRFRLQPAVEDWALAVDKACGEILLRREYESIMELISLISDASPGAPPHPRTARVIIHPDGSGTVTDSFRRVEYTAAEDECIVCLLLGLAPDKVEVYDLNAAGSAALRERIRRIFGERARIYIKN